MVCVMLECLWSIARAAKRYKEQTDYISVTITTLHHIVTAVRFVPELAKLHGGDHNKHCLLGCNAV